MSSLMQVRWQRFKQHKLGFSCFIIFSAIFIISLGAELIANDKPLLVKYDHAFYLPILKSYPETTFGGVFETEAEYKDPAVQQLIAEKAGRSGPSFRFPIKRQILNWLNRCHRPRVRKTGWEQMIRAVMFWHGFYMV